MKNPLAERAMRPWQIVAQREITTRLRDRTFRIGSAFLLLLVIGSIIPAAILGGKGEKSTVGVTTTSAHQVAVAAGSAVKAVDKKNSVEVQQYSERSAVLAAVKDGDIDAGLFPTANGFQVIGNSDVSSTLYAGIRAAVFERGLATNAHAAGTSSQRLLTGTTTTQHLLDAKDTNHALKGVAFISTLIFFITAVSFGMLIAQSVTQEKESRVVEILAASIPARALLWGKIIGNTVLGLGQIVLLVVVGLIGLAATGRTDLIGHIGPASIFYLLFFMAGFVGLAAVWSVAGSIVTRQDELQASTLPAQILLLIPYIVSVAAPKAVVAWMSMVPIWSSLIMPGRIATGDATWWQVVLALLLAVLAAIGLVRLGARMYERTLLQTSRRSTYREVLGRPTTA